MIEDIIITKDLKFDLEDLMLPVNFDTEFTLRDLLRAAISSKIPLEFLSAILRCNYISKYWLEAESKPFKDRDIEYLEIYWWGSKSTYEGKREDGFSWGFHGVGRAGEICDDLRKHCEKEEIQKMEDEGYRQAYAVEFTPLYELADYPIKLKEELFITDYDAPINEDMDRTIDMIPSITLIELLYWVFWELSFLGSPEERDEKNEHLEQQVKDLKEGKLETVPWEEVKEKLEKRFNIEKDSPFEETKESLEEAHEHSKGNLDLKTTKDEGDKGDKEE